MTPDDHQDDAERSGMRGRLRRWGRAGREKDRDETSEEELGWLADLRSAKEEAADIGPGDSLGPPRSTRPPAGPLADRTDPPPRGPAGRSHGGTRSGGPPPPPPRTPAADRPAGLSAPAGEPSRAAPPPVGPARLDRPERRGAEEPGRCRRRHGPAGPGALDLPVSGSPGGLPARWRTRCCPLAGAAAPAPPCSPAPPVPLRSLRPRSAAG